jgi:uncharacterized protein (DUF302 family)
MNGTGIITIPSGNGMTDTVNRVEMMVKSKGLTAFTTIDHAAGIKDVGMPLAPTFLLIFGNAKGGTRLMNARQDVGIDLPLNVLVWQDSAGRVWLTDNDPGWIAKRHGLGHEVDPNVEAVRDALATITTEAAR